MTPQEIAARLPELTGGPHDDATITALAQITAEAIRALNHATFPRAGLSEPATVYRVLGELATAANRLPQLCSQLARWLEAGEHRRASRPRPPAPCPRPCTMPRPASTCWLPRMWPSSPAPSTGAQQATAGLYRPGGGDEDQ